MKQKDVATFYKQFKDPIYGYIEISSGIVSEIIDTPTFQRLKDIRQTSYTPLFPSAHHNRYVHSIGVYHLGQMAFESVKPQLIKENDGGKIAKHIDSLQAIFELACLLHDVGHAPFSHTGETFFIDKADTLYTSLKQSVDEPGFQRDFDALGPTKPAPHECMSCVVGLKKFPTYFKTAMERNLFARCITGMSIDLTMPTPSNSTAEMTAEEKRAHTKEIGEYKEKKKEIELVNCVISLLNSSIIDVDRLDYIIRDAATVGFKNVQVDYIRLLRGMRIVWHQNEWCVGYHKSALSVIESAVYAHDAEKKWIQSHPSILYEMEVLKNAMSTLTGIFSSSVDPNPLFCYEALTEKGKVLTQEKPLLSSEKRKECEAGTLSIWTPDATSLIENGDLFEANCGIDATRLVVRTEYPISLLADEDILYLMKCFCKQGFGYEYFARNIRRSAVWKSEAEFRALFQQRIGDDTEHIRRLEDDFNGLVRYCQDKFGIPIVQDTIYEQLEKESADATSAKEKKEIGDDAFDDIIAGVKRKKHWADILKEATTKLKIPFEFLIIFQKTFNSSFKSEMGNIPIVFPNLDDKPVLFRKVVGTLKAEETRKSNFFHLFYRTDGPIDVEKKKEIIRELTQALIAGTNL